MSLPLARISGLGGGSIIRRLYRTRKRATPMSQKIDWAIDKVTKIFVKPRTPATTSVDSRVTINYDISHLVEGVWVPQEPEEIGLLEVLEDEVVCDLHVCGVLKFLRDLYHATPSDLGMTVMLGRNEPVCLGEQVVDRPASLEEQNEREVIYQKHLDAQAALVVATAAAVDAAYDAAAGACAAAVVAAGFDLLMALPEPKKECSLPASRC